MLNSCERLQHTSKQSCEQTVVRGKLALSPLAITSTRTHTDIAEETHEMATVNSKNFRYGRFITERLHDYPKIIRERKPPSIPHFYRTYRYVLKNKSALFKPILSRLRPKRARP